MIPVIIQQFLIDLDAESTSKTIAKIPNNIHSDDNAIAMQSINFNDIEQFWNDFLHMLPNDLDSIWDTIVNGLLRYLQV